MTDNTIYIIAAVCLSFALALVGWLKKQKKISCCGSKFEQDIELSAQNSPADSAANQAAIVTTILSALQQQRPQLESAPAPPLPIAFFPQSTPRASPQ